MGRVVTAGIVGGVALFVGGFLAHSVLPLGEMGLKQLPNEEAALVALKGAAPEAGLYFFPWIDHSAPEEAQKAWAEKVRTGPSGLLAYQPSGGEAMSPKQLVVQGLGDVLAALVAAYLLCRSALTSYGGRLLAVILLGVVAFLSTNLPYWNWYGFAADFTLGQGLALVFRWFVGGLALAALAKPAPPAPA